MNLILTGQQISEIQFLSHPKSDTPFSVEKRYSFNMAYSSDNSRCRATLRQEGRAEDAPERFSFEIEMFGFFDCEGIYDSEDKLQAHMLAYQLLFPHMQAFIRTLTTQAGMPPLMLAPDPPKKEDIEFSPDTK